LNQDQQPRPWWRDNRLIWALAALPLVGLLITTILGYWQRWAWTELLWRWLELLIIPVVLAAGALWFNTQERRAQDAIETRRQESEQALAEDRASEEALQRYLGTMQGLILDYGLRRSEKDAEIRHVARARALTVLRSLDGNRKGDVVQFLYEADLIGKRVVGESGERQVIEAIIDSQAADLSDANLREANLRGVDLISANLMGANLTDANLIDANLSGANLSGANLTNANLIDANLNFANLSGANLTDTNLINANLNFANLSGANLTNANLISADLWDVNLSGADLTRAYLGDAQLGDADLSGTNLYYTSLSDTNLMGANLGGANLSGANLTNANLINANLRGAEGWTNEQLAQAESLVGATMPDGTKMTEEAWEEFKKGYRQ
jgi:uncharacterized protein YjbI with pentapeptide repeats